MTKNKFKLLLCLFFYCFVLTGGFSQAFGYKLAKVDFNSFKKYEYVSRTSLGEMTAEIYMEQALKFVKESPKPNPLN